MESKRSSLPRASNFRPSSTERRMLLPKLAVNPSVPTFSSTPRLVKSPIPKRFYSPLPVSHREEALLDNIKDGLLKQLPLPCMDLPNRLLRKDELILQWSLIPTLGAYPESRSWAFLLDFGPRIYLYGGQKSSAQNELYYFTYPECIWERVLPKNLQDSPPARSGQTSLSYKAFIVVYGGYETYDEILKVRNCSKLVYFYDTLANTWNSYKPDGKSPEGRRNHSAALVGESMMIYGGLDSKGNLVSGVEVLDLSSLLWDTPQITGDFPPDRQKCTLTPIFPESLKTETQFNIYQVVNEADKSGKKLYGIYMFGGISKSGEAMNDLYVLSSRNACKKASCVTLHWSVVETKGRVPTARYDHCSAYNTKFLIVFGGRNDKIDGAITAEIGMLRMTTLTWEIISLYEQVPSHRFGIASVCLNDKILVYGGMNFKGFVAGDLYELNVHERKGIKRLSIIRNIR